MAWKIFNIGLKFWLNLLLDSFSNTFTAFWHLIITVYLATVSIEVVLLLSYLLFMVIQIYGIDAASGAAVLALNISGGDNVLDLCAAPGK